MISRHGILYVEPSARISGQPVIDELTRKMAGAFRQAPDNGRSWRGCHICACGAVSSNTDYVLPNGEETNSLCVHYLAYHRDELPKEQLAKVAALEVDPIEPTEEDLHAPPNPQPTGWDALRKGLGYRY
jgi:hypothetical protein